MLHIESGTCNRQQTHRREHREASAHVVGNDERLVAFLVGAGAGSATLGIGDGYDDILCLFLAHLCLALLLQQTEGQGCLRGGTTLRDVDDAELLTLQILGELKEIVFADVVAGKEDDRILLVLYQPAERVAQGLDDSAGTKIGATDASHDHHFAFCTQGVGYGLHLVEECRCDAAGQMQPSKEIVTRARAIFQCLLCLFYLWLESLHCTFREEACSLCNVKTNTLHIVYGLKFLVSKFLVHALLAERVGEELDFNLWRDAFVENVVDGIEDRHVDMHAAVDLLHALRAEIALGNHLHLNLC